MGSYLSIPRGRLLGFQGWGKMITSEEHNCRVELADVGQFVIYRAGALREKVLASIPITELSLDVYTNQILTGTRWRGGGYGLGGALAGKAQADVLNWLTSRTDEYTILQADQFVPNGARRQALIGFIKLDESLVRDRLAQALTDWTDAYVTTRSPQLADATAQDDLRRLHADIDRIHRLRTICAGTAADLHRRASDPFVHAFLDRLHRTPPTHQEAQRISSDVEQLTGEGHLTKAQAKQIIAELASSLQGPQPSPPPATPTRHQQRQLQALAALHSLGAMSDTQFEHEKAHLLNGGR